MWVEIADAEGVPQGRINLDGIDLVKLGPPHGDNYYTFTVTKGSAVKVYYVDGTEIEKLNRYFDIKR